jgi:hypothetical protein
MSAAFESVARICPERWILPPIQKIIADYDGIHCPATRSSSPSPPPFPMLLSADRAVKCVYSIQCVRAG